MRARAWCGPRRDAAPVALPGLLCTAGTACHPPFPGPVPLSIHSPPPPRHRPHPLHRFFDRNVKNLVKKLLTADLTKRYGCLKSGAEDIKKHKWLSSIDYNALYSRTLTAPIAPRYALPCCASRPSATCSCPLGVPSPHVCVVFRRCDVLFAPTCGSVLLCLASVCCSLSLLPQRVRCK